MSITHLNRRAFLLTPLALPFALGAATRPGIVLRPRSIVVNGKPVFLIAGTVDYFRCPRELWRDILLRAKRAGLNSISFYIAWNFHETEEGRCDFTGQRDLGHFLDLCAELNLLAWPRFGPFICAEWEAGGYPAWLIAKPNVELRTVNDVALPYVRRWMEHVVPILVPRQATRGGPVILIQQENEYYLVGRPGVRAYQQWLIRNLRELGIEVPITDCNGTNAETRVPDSFLTMNGGGEQNIRSLQKAHPDKPAIISEHYTDYMNCWGWPVSSYPTTTMLRQQTMETLAAGGMYTYFMFYGGTNFGFWASTTWKSDQSFVTTRYFSRSPINEGGALNDSYFATKAINLPAANLQEFLTSGEGTAMPVKLSGPIRASALRCAAGYLLFVQPQYPTRVSSIYHTDNQSGPFIQLGEEWPLSEIAAARGVLEIDGRSESLAESASYTSLLPYRLQIDPRYHIDYSNATLIGRIGAPERRVLVFRGESGAHGVVSINGQERAFVFPDDEPAKIAGPGGVTILAVSHELADRTWFTGNRVLIGPAYVGEERQSQHRCFLDGRTHSITTVSAAGAIDSRDVKPGAAMALEVALPQWTAHTFAELHDPSSLAWRALDAPRAVEELHAYMGYTWYRASFRSSHAVEVGLFFTAASDRVHVFVNGRKSGIWGRGSGAVRDPLPVSLESGDNHFVFLCDNMGRLSEGAVLDHKGIYGPAYIGARLAKLERPEWSTPATAPSESWQYQTFRYFNPDGEFRRATYQLAAKPGEGLQLALRWLPQYAWITIDGSVVAEHAGDLSLAGGVDFSSAVLDAHLKPGRAQQLEITTFGTVPANFEGHVRLVAYPQSARLQDWGFRSWSESSAQTRNPLSWEPVWWKTDFPNPSVPGPFFLVTQGLSKGQAYINGHALGRYWEIGPQHSLYVPEPWLSAQNRLSILDEEGCRADAVYLMRDTRVATDSIWL